MEQAVTIIMPTYNSERTITECLTSIREQNYSQENITIFVIDGGSTDKTVEIAKKFNAVILENKLRTAEAAKAVGLKQVTTPYIALIDSDNILPSKTWLTEMMVPFKDKDIIASEPIRYTHRPKDNYITRYGALVGAGDPLTLFLKNYDRFNHITGTWTEVERKEEQKEGYLKVWFKDVIPTIGANGAIIQTDLLKKFLEKQESQDYLFDIDALAEVMITEKKAFAKTDNGMVHLLAGDVRMFTMKQKRRISDFLFFSKKRTYPWDKVQKKQHLIKFSLYTALIIPTTLQALKGYMKKRDIAWFFYPIACLITLWTYGTTFLLSKIRPPKEMSRKGWKQ